jgi:hypothetical protein
MAASLPHFGPVNEAPKQSLPRALAIGVAALALLFAVATLVAQVGGERGIAPTASTSDIEITGIEVDVRAGSAEEARQEAWQRAQRLAWNKAGGPQISDSQLSSLVLAIVIEREQLGPRRYIATLGVVFDRQRAGRFLGGIVQGRSSAPMMLLPVTVQGGAYTVYEVRNPWQRAWAEFNPGSSRIDYVRPTGAGGDSLLLTYGQTGRRSRAWWRNVLDQFNAADVLVPIAKLDHQYPGGPITGTFTARYGPDSDFLEQFELTVDSPDQLQAMLNQAVRRLDGIFVQALVDGKLRPDPTLRETGTGEADPAIARLIEIGRAIQARDLAEAEAAALPSVVSNPAVEAEPTPQATATVVRAYVVQFATPDAAAFDTALNNVRGVPGVRGLAVTSTAMGGTSVMSVSFGGTLDQLAAQLRARGFTVQQGSNALAISR